MAAIHTISESFIEELASIIVARLSPDQIGGFIDEIRQIECQKFATMMDLARVTTRRENWKETGQLDKEIEEFRLLVNAIRDEERESSMARAKRIVDKEKVRAWKKVLTNESGEQESQRNGKGTGGVKK